MLRWCVSFMAWRAVALTSPPLGPPLPSVIHTNGSCPQGFKVDGILRRSRVTGCREDFTDCGVCACVPGNVCGHCPKIIAFSLSNNSTGSLGMSDETYNESEAQDTWDPPLPVPVPSEDRIWGRDGTVQPVSWPRYTSTFPFLVALKRSGKYGKYHFCGGSLIRETHVLSAAHCFYQNGGWTVNVDDIEVWWGHGNNEWISSKVDLLVIPSLFTGRYSRGGWDHDVAVLRLSRRFSGARVARLSHRSSYSVGSEAVIAGWGTVNEAMTIIRTDKLQEGKKSIASASHCRKYDSNFQSQKMICTTSWSSGVGSGDSGGPLLQYGYQIGICSHASRFLGYSFYDAFTRVSSFTGWIAGVLSEHP